MNKNKKLIDMLKDEDYALFEHCKSFLLSLFLEVESFKIRVKVWGMEAIECLKLISDGDSVSIANLAVKENSYNSERELVFTKNSTLKVL